MKKLNHKIKLGDRFEMVVSGWRYAEVPRGQYEIIGYARDGEDDEYIVKQVDGEQTYIMDKRNLECLCGEDVQPEYGVRYDCEEYQPTEEETEDEGFITKEDASFDFWYRGSFGNMKYIRSSWLETDFAWVHMPW